jgi:hypothetical protein
MADGQRRVFAEAEIAWARAGARTQLASENVATLNVEGYTGLTDDICTYEDPGWLVSVSNPDIGRQGDRTLRAGRSTGQGGGNVWVLTACDGVPSPHHDKPSYRDDDR